LSPSCTPPVHETRLFVLSKGGLFPVRQYFFPFVSVVRDIGSNASLPHLKCFCVCLGPPEAFLQELTVSRPRFFSPITLSWSFTHIFFHPPLLAPGPVEARSFPFCDLLTCHAENIPRPLHSHCAGSSLLNSLISVPPCVVFFGDVHASHCACCPPFSFLFQLTMKSFRRRNL